MIMPLHQGLFIIAPLFLVGSLPGSAQKEFSPLQKFSADALVKYVGFSSDSKHLFIGTTTGEFTTWDFSRNRQVQRLITGREVRQYVPGPKGTLYTLHADGTLGLRERNTGNLLKLFKFERAVTYICPGPMERLYFQLSVSVYYITPAGATHHTGWRYMPVFSVDGKVAAVPMEKDKVAICNAETGKTIRTITVVPYKQYGYEGYETLIIALSPDGKHLATAEYGRENDRVAIIDVATNKIIRRIEFHKTNSPIEELLFSPNGKFLLAKGTPSYSWGSWLHLYSVKSGKLIGLSEKTLTDTPAFSLDGKWLAFSFAGSGPRPHGWSYYVGLFRLPSS